MTDQEFLDEIKELRDQVAEMESRIEWCLDQIDILLAAEVCTHKKEELH